MNARRTFVTRVLETMGNKEFTVHEALDKTNFYKYMPLPKSLSFQLSRDDRVQLVGVRKVYLGAQYREVKVWKRK